MAEHTRLERNAPGDWYTTGECMACGAPEAEAPELLSPLSNDDLETYFARQPESAEEISRACRAARVCCVSAIRYGGRNPEIIAALGNTGEYSDFVIAPTGELRPAPAWTFTTLATSSAPRWWQFWRRSCAS